MNVFAEEEKLNFGNQYFSIFMMLSVRDCTMISNVTEIVNAIQDFQKNNCTLLLRTSGKSYRNPECRIKYLKSGRAKRMGEGHLVEEAVNLCLFSAVAIDRAGGS